MQLSESYQIYGVPQGIYYGQFDRTDELNMRTHSRQFSDKPLTPQYDMRPVSTKYALFPIIDRRTPSQTHLEQNLQNNENYNLSTNFSPATRNGPVSGYVSNVDKESTLRNLGIAIQRGAEQGVYVPSSNSDLYKISITPSPSIQPHPELFRIDTFGSYRRAPVGNIGNDIFMNHTRTQLRNLHE